jgi:serine/threonine protein kinase
MPQPLTTDQLVALIRKSSLLDPERLDRFLRDLTEGSEELPAPADLAQRLVDAGLLSTFQSEQLLQGKWRGFTIGKYRVLERLGSGGMGSVYLCEHVQMHRRVAVKVLPIAKAQDPAALGRFYREARAAGLLDHPNLVRAHDIDQDGELHYLVMDYVDGVNLQRLVTRRNGLLPVARACHYVHQALQGLNHAWHSGLIHRDLKPANILLDRSGTIRILDLGLARFYEDHQDLLTLKYDDNNVLGTADYVSPEQAHDSHDVDIRTDIYSLGATFYFCLTGQTLFPEGKVAQKLIWHQTREPKPVRALRPEVPAELEAIITKMLAKDREERYQTPAEALEALEPWVKEPIPPPTDEEIPRLSLAARASALEVAARTPAPLSLRRRRKSDQGTRQPGSGDAPPRSGRASGRAPSASPPVVAAASGSSAGDQATPRVLAGDTPVSCPLPVASQPATSQPHDSGRPPIAESQKPRRSLRLSVLVLALLVGSGAGLLLRLSLVGAGPGEESGQESGVLVVDRSGKEGRLPTLLAALEKARPGDRIEVREATWEECLRLDSGGALGRGVTIEGTSPKGPVVWSVPAGHKEGQSLLHLSAVSGLRLRNFILDGKDQVRHLITLSGPCPGLVFEDVRLKGFRASAVHLTNCTGDEGSPLQLSGLHVAPDREATAGLLFEAFQDQACRHVRVSGCRFDGPCQAGVVVNGPIADVELSGNRFDRLTDGILVGRAMPQPPVQLALTRNTFRDVQRAALHFETTPPVEGSRLVLEGNTFLRTRSLGLTDGFRPEPSDLAASWIWSPGEAPASAPAGRAFFRRTFSLSGMPTRGTLSTTSNGSFTVWLNGERVGQGTFDATKRRVQAFDVARYLRQGDNVLAVEAEGAAQEGPRASASGLLVELSDNSTVVYARTLISDAMWKASSTAPPGWQAQTFDDRAWQPVRVIAEYGKGEPSWQNLVWDAVLQEHFKYQPQRVFPGPSGNQRDDRSPEGFPSFDATVVPAEQLEADKR